MAWRATGDSHLIPNTSRTQDRTYYMDCFQVRPRRLFTAAAILKTNEENQNALTDFSSRPSVNRHEDCKVVAVTPEKNVATVDKFSRFAAA